MTKWRASSPMRQLSGWRSRLIIILSVLLCVLAFLRVFHSQANLQSSFPTSRRRSRAVIDNQFDGPPKVAFLLLVRRDLPLDFLWGTFFKVCFLVLVPFIAVCSKLNKKILICFVLSFAEWWCSKILDLHSFQAWFCVWWINHKVCIVFWSTVEQQHSGGLLASLNTSTSTASIFFIHYLVPRCVCSSKIDCLFMLQVVWGESSMIEAERLLFEEALYDPANQRFVLLSDR